LEVVGDGRLQARYNQRVQIVHSKLGRFSTRRIDMRRMFGFLIGVVVGALIGSMVALLLTPESGEQLRAQIRERGQSFANQIRSAADSRRIELRGRLESLRAPRES